MPGGGLDCTWTTKGSYVHAEGVCRSQYEDHRYVPKGVILTGPMTAFEQIVSDDSESGDEDYSSCSSSSTTSSSNCLPLLLPVE